MKEYIDAHVAVETQQLLQRHFDVVSSTTSAGDLCLYADALHSLKSGAEDQSARSADFDKLNMFVGRVGEDRLQAFAKDQMPDTFWTTTLFEVANAPSSILSVGVIRQVTTSPRWK